MTTITLIKQPKPLVFTRSADAVEAWISADDLCALAGVGGRCEARHHLLAVVPRAWVERLWAEGRGQHRDGSPLLAPDGRLVLMLRRAAAGAVMAAGMLSGAGGQPLGTMFMEKGQHSKSPGRSPYSGWRADDPEHEGHYLATSAYPDASSIVQSRDPNILRTAVGNGLAMRKPSTLLELSRQAPTTAPLFNQTFHQAFWPLITNANTALRGLSDLMIGFEDVMATSPVKSLIQDIRATQTVDRDYLHSASFTQIKRLILLHVMNTTAPSRLKESIASTLKAARKHDPVLLVAGGYTSAREPVSIAAPTGELVGTVASLEKQTSSFLQAGRAAIEDILLVDAAVKLHETLIGTSWAWPFGGEAVEKAQTGLATYGAYKAASYAMPTVMSALASPVNSLVATINSQWSSAAWLALPPQAKFAVGASAAAIATTLPVVTGAAAFLAEVQAEANRLHAKLTTPLKMDLITLCDTPGAALYSAWAILQRGGALPKEKNHLSLLPVQERRLIGERLAVQAHSDAAYAKKLDTQFRSSKDALLHISKDVIGSRYLQAMKGLDTPGYFDSPVTKEAIKHLPALPKGQSERVALANMLGSMWLLLDTVGSEQSLASFYYMALSKLSHGESVNPSRPQRRSNPGEEPPLRFKANIPPTPSPGGDPLDNISSTFFKVVPGFYTNGTAMVSSGVQYAWGLTTDNRWLIFLALIVGIAGRYIGKTALTQHSVAVVSNLKASWRIGGTAKQVVEALRPFQNLIEDEMKMVIIPLYESMQDDHGSIPFEHLIDDDEAFNAFQASDASPAHWLGPLNSYWALLRTVVDIPNPGTTAHNWPAADAFDDAAIKARTDMMTIVKRHLPPNSVVKCFTSEAYRRIYHIEQCIFDRIDNAGHEARSLKILQGMKSGQNLSEPFDLDKEKAALESFFSRGDKSDEDKRILCRDFIRKAMLAAASTHADLFMLNHAGYCNVAKVHQTTVNAANFGYLTSEAARLFDASSDVAMSLLHTLLESRQENAEYLRFINDLMKAVLQERKDFDDLKIRLQQHEQALQDLEERLAKATTQHERTLQLYEDEIKNSIASEEQVRKLEARHASATEAFNAKMATLRQQIAAEQTAKQSLASKLQEAHNLLESIPGA